MLVQIIAVILAGLSILYLNHNKIKLPNEEFLDDIQSLPTNKESLILFVIITSILSVGIVQYQSSIYNLEQPQPVSNYEISKNNTARFTITCEPNSDFLISDYQSLNCNIAGKSESNLSDVSRLNFRWFDNKDLTYRGGGHVDLDRNNKKFNLNLPGQEGRYQLEFEPLASRSFQVDRNIEADRGITQYYVISKSEFIARSASKSSINLSFAVLVLAIFSAYGLVLKVNERKYNQLRTKRKYQTLSIYWIILLIFFTAISIIITDIIFNGLPL